MTANPDGDAQVRAAFVELAAAFRSSAILLGALELDLFSHIPDAGARPETIGRSLGVDPHPLRLMLNALAAMGVLRADDGRFSVPPEYAPLLRRGPGSFAEYLLVRKQENEVWLRMDAILKGEYTGSAVENVYLQEGNAAHYLDAIARNIGRHADAALERLAPAMAGAARVLDIGGGSGEFAARILALNQNTMVTVLDLETSLAHSRARQAAGPYADRLTFVAGDARTQDYEGAFDLVLMSDLLHFFSAADKAEVLRRGVRALTAGGTIAVLKPRLAESGREPASSALFSLRIYVGTLAGYVETDGEAADLLMEAGARDVQVIPVNDERTLLIGIR